MIKLSFRGNDYSFQDRDFKLCLKVEVQMHTQRNDICSDLFQAWFTRNVFCTVFLTVLKWVE